MTVTTIRQRMLPLKTLLVFTGLVLFNIGRFIWAHRRQILDAIARAILATYEAGRWCGARRHHVTDFLLLVFCAVLDAVAWTHLTIETLVDEAADLVHQQPVPALAPITAGMDAARLALTRLIARLYPQPVV